MIQREENQKHQIESLSNQVEEATNNIRNLEKVIDEREIEIEKLKNELIITNKTPEVDMTTLDPFIIFSTNQFNHETQINNQNEKYKSKNISSESDSEIK